jgi:hypothetical protein
MAADENYRLSDIALPDLPVSGYSNQAEAPGRILEFLRELIQAITQRDLEIKNKVNQLHCEYVTTEPSDAPDEPEPVFRIYQTGGNYYLYVYGA